MASWWIWPHPRDSVMPCGQSATWNLDLDTYLHRCAVLSWSCPLFPTIKIPWGTAFDQEFKTQSILCLFHQIVKKTPEDISIGPNMESSQLSDWSGVQDPEYFLVFCFTELYRKHLAEDINIYPSMEMSSCPYWSGIQDPEQFMVFCFTKLWRKHLAEDINNCPNIEYV